jgi:DNA-binding transcriptional regulator WhiA
LDIMEGSVPSKTKEETAHIARAGVVGALVAVGSLAHPEQKDLYCLHPILCHDMERRMVVNLD